MPQNNGFVKLGRRDYILIRDILTDLDRDGEEDRLLEKINRIIHNIDEYNASKRREEEVGKR